MPRFKEVGSVLRDLRELRGLTQDRVASAVKISKGMISKYESGTVEPSLSKLGVLLDLYQISLATLEKMLALREKTVETALPSNPQLKAAADFIDERIPPRAEEKLATTDEGESEGEPSPHRRGAASNSVRHQR